MQQGTVLIIYTGGTIGMVINPLTGSLLPLNFDQISEQVPELKKFGFRLDTISFEKPLDSSDIGPDIWIKIASIIKDNYDNYDGFVILHGTDTMAYSASALSFMLKNLAKPVIFTGSQLPIGVLRTDGKENIITAIEIAAARDKGKAIVPEVCIYFENKLYRGNRTTKINAENFKAFQSANYPALAEVGIDIKYNREAILPTNNNLALELSTEFDNHIAILKLFPGMNRAFIDSILGICGLKGLIIETFGSGNAPAEEWFLKRIRKATESGIIVLDITQCTTGSVILGRYETGRKLFEAGVIGGYDITTEAATTKMMCLFGKHQNSEDVKRDLNISLAGEITTL
ncbi:MAG: asparaginase [Bacteroidales bacterium]|nr:asparaginase [Bacteroidales bacterium]MCF8391167.1 asparaginase [Bacteroidales bacterium]